MDCVRIEWTKFTFFPEVTFSVGNSNDVTYCVILPEMGNDMNAGNLAVIFHFQYFVCVSEHPDVWSSDNF